MTFEEARDKLCIEHSCTVTENKNEIQVMTDSGAYIVYIKLTDREEIHNLGLPLALTIKPIYKLWRAMIKAWLVEKREKSYER